MCEFKCNLHLIAGTFCGASICTNAARFFPWIVGSLGFSAACAAVVVLVLLVSRAVKETPDE